jgi:hypothetical protein
VAVPAPLWLDVVENVLIYRPWERGSRTLSLTWEENATLMEHDVEPMWSSAIEPDSPITGFTADFALYPLLQSMHMTGNVGDDALRHAVEPLIAYLPDTIAAFAVHGREDAESVAHSLINLWLASAFADNDKFVAAYRRAAAAVSGMSGPSERATTLFLTQLTTDAHRMSPPLVGELLLVACRSSGFGPAHLMVALECLATVAAENPEEVAEATSSLTDLELNGNDWTPEIDLRIQRALDTLRFPEIYRAAPPQRPSTSR